MAHNEPQNAFVLPPLMRVGAMAASGLTLVSAILVAFLAVLGPLIVKGTPTSWFLFGFEVVVIVAAVLGFQLARGKWSHGLAIGLLSIAGTILLASAMGWQGANRRLLDRPLLPLLLVRTACAGVLALLACHAVLGRRPGAWQRALLGAAIGAPAVLLLGAMAVSRTRQVVLGVLPSNQGLMIIVAVCGFVVFAALLAASVHILVATFQNALDDERVT